MGNVIQFGREPALRPSVIKRRNAETKQWQAKQKRRALVAHHARKRHAMKLRRTPSWADHDAIRRIYEKAAEMTAQTGVQHHVDHIIPLQGRLASGLHVHTNLQVLTASENIRKRNRFDPAAD